MSSRPPKLDLPFRPRRTDPGEWAYDHRAGLCVVVICFLLLGIAMVSWRIALGARVDAGAIYVEIEAAPEPIPEPEQQLRELSEADYREAINRISNENAAHQRATSSAASRALAQELAERQAALAEQMAGNRRALEAGRAEEAAIAERRNIPARERSTEEDRDARVAGQVLVSFSLTAPLRTSIDLVVPGYRCRGGGEVVIEIVVDNSGRVTSASASQASRSADECMLSTALAAARSSRFNLDASAPAKQRGTISYLFVPQ